MRTADFDDSDDEWLIDVLTNKGSPLIECYGRYPGDPTDSWHAHWIPDRCTVDVEAEWKITKSGKMKKFDIKLFISTNGDFSERSYREVTPKTFDIKASGSWNPMTSRGTFTLTIDGVNTPYTDTGLSEVKNKI